MNIPNQTKIISTIILIPVLLLGTWGILSCGGIGIACGIVFMLVGTIGLVKLWP